MAPSDSRTRELETLYAVEASGWVETMRRASPGDEMRFVAWLKESPRNVRDFLLMLSLDQALETLDAERLRSIEALIAKVDARVRPLMPRAAAASPAGTPGAVPAGSAAGARPRPLRRAALAAGVLVAAAGVLLWYAHPGFREFETATGEQRTFELEDGSVVSLNTHSRIAVRLGPHTREVRLLRGEALFHVAHDPGRPFLVSTDDAVVQAVGTQFDVYRRDDGTVVAVLEGRVDVTAAAPAPASSGSAAQPVAGRRAAARSSAARSLGASQEAQVSHEGSVSIREVNNVSDTVAWRERRLIFRDQTLGQIVSEFNRYRAHPIRLEGSAVSERVYTGVFDADDAESLLQVLAQDPALEVERSAGGITVRPRPE
jgi:transmembrane sensor